MIMMRVSSQRFKVELFILTHVCVVYRMYVRIYRRLPARLGHSAQLGLACRLLGNSPYTLHSRLLGNSPTIPPFQPRRVLPPSPAICLPT